MRRLAATLFTAVLATTSLAATAASAHAATSFTTTSLHFKVTVGQNNEVCDIVGDLYLPSPMPSTPIPSILTTNGFGGSKADQAGFGQAYAARGYAVLSYSGLGFGGSGCQITLDDPAYDGAAGSQLVDYLGGKDGIAFLDAAHTQPAPRLTVVVHDHLAHDGKAYTYDPRVGMIGGSYGGEIQFAIAGQDPRVDTIVPMITWNNLNYSLAPNNANPDPGKVTSAVPGAVKFFWATGFSAIGVEDGVQGAQADPTRLVPCPNFAAWVCPGLAYGAATGTLDSTTSANLQHASVANYIKNIKIPTLLMQGEFDTLFNLNEAAANLAGLTSSPDVRMIWQSWGHSHSSPAPGEFSLNSPNFGHEYETDRVANWFDHYLKGAATNLGPKFAYFRDWISYTGDAAPAFQSSSHFPLPTTRYYLGGTDLATGASSGTGAQAFVTAPGGLPTSISPLDAIGSALPAGVPEKDLPGTFAQWDSAPLASDLAVVGSPALHLSVKATVTGLLGGLSPLTDLVLFVRLQDVAPDGTASDIRQLTAPIRVNPSLPFTVQMPAIVHDFAAGHRLRLIVAGGSLNYRGGVTGDVVQISGGSGQTLDLPIGH